MSRREAWKTSAVEPELRVSDADRERTALALRDACAEGRITLDELSERLDRAYSAKTQAELDRVVADLPAPAPQPPARRARRWVVGIMGGSVLRGRWRLEQRATAVSVMGGTVIDLRGAEIAGPEATIVCVCVMGGASVIVPEGVPVEVSGISIMGGRDTRVKDVELRPGIPFVRVRAYTLMGGVEVKSRPVERPALPT